VEGYQVIHGPSISLADRYDVIAKASTPVPVDQVKAMLQVLLEERLNLKIHRAAPDDETPAAQITGESVVFRKSSLPALASLLTSLPSLGRPVFDRTGLSGLYDFTLRLDNQAGKSGDNANADLFRGMDEAVFSNLADLGLKLEPQKAAVEFIVIDHADKIPADN
jgi:hypothetical protein